MKVGSAGDEGHIHAARIHRPVRKIRDVGPYRSRAVALNLVVADREDGRTARFGKAVPSREAGTMLRARRQGALEGDVPTWPRFGDGEAPRVLIEHPDPAAQRFLADAFRLRGFDTLTCGGPTPQGSASVACPLLTEGACPAVDGSDVVVSSLQVNQGYEGLVVRAIVEDPTAPPVLLEASTWQLSQTELSDAVADRCFPFSSPSQVVDRAVALLIP